MRVSSSWWIIGLLVLAGVVGQVASLSLLPGTWEAMRAYPPVPLVWLTRKCPPHTSTGQRRGGWGGILRRHDAQTAHSTVSTLLQQRGGAWGLRRDKIGDAKALSSVSKRKAPAKSSSTTAVAAPKTKVVLLTRKEAPKFFALSLMMFCIIYVFTMTRDTKDTLIVSYCGAEAIAFLKVYGVVPAAMAFMVGYSWAANHLSKRSLFYVTIVPFFAFYALFAYVLYPNRHNLHLEQFAPVAGSSMPYVRNLVRYWIFSIYYITSELWGSAGVPLLFWQCANDVTPIDQAKRFYPLFAVLGNMAPIVSGQTTAYVSKWIKRLHPNDEHLAFENTLKVLTSFMMGAGTIVMILYWYVMDVSTAQAAEAQALLSKSALKKKQAAANAAKKSKPSLMESMRILSKSTWLECIAVMVVSYGLTMEFTEIIWKATVKMAYPRKQDYMEFMGNYSTVVGIMTVLMLLLGSNTIKILGWRVGAMATPVLMATLAAPFFAYITFGDMHGSRKALMTALTIGTVQNILSKATKYAFFDPTKEMAYIPLDQEAKVKGKAAIDVLGARLGKSGGALGQQALVLAFGGIMRGAPVLAGLFYLVIFGWLASVDKLAHLFQENEKKTAASSSSSSHH